MMRLWADSYTKTAPLLSSAALSAVAHAILISAWVYVTLPSSDVPENSLANRVFYIPPPDRTGGQSGIRETVKYITVATGPLIGGEARKIGDEPPLVHAETVGTPPKDTVTVPDVPAVPGPPDSVFSVLEVDTPVARSANSAAPAYPIDLLKAHIVGAVNAQYVVDTTGFADSVSFRVLSSTNPKFEDAVRAALPYMRFSPAMIGKSKVRQLVEQQFTFKINDPVSAAVGTGPKKP